MGGGGGKSTSEGGCKMIVNDAGVVTVMPSQNLYLLFFFYPGKEALPFCLHLISNLSLMEQSVSHESRVWCMPSCRMYMYIFRP